LTTIKSKPRNTDKKKTDAGLIKTLIDGLLASDRNE
jgi:hypothetical protein